MQRVITIAVLVLLAAAVVFLFLGGSADEGLVFWTTDHEPDRMKIQREIAEEFAAARGGGAGASRVSVQPVPEQKLKEVLSQQIAAGMLPDVIRAGIEHVVGYERDGLLDAEMATAVIKDLGVDSFAAGALAPVKRGGMYLAVPVDGWAQGIWYRKDLFDAKGLKAPTDWPAILAAAEALTVRDELDPRYGIALPRHPGSQYPQQIFEQLAMSAGARLFDDEGKVDCDQPAIRRTVELWKKLSRFCPEKTLVEPAQAQLLYLTGKAAMIFYSPYILDDIAGMTDKKDNLDRPDLAKVTGFAPVISEEPGGRGAGYAQLVYLCIMKDAPPVAKDWCRHLLTDAYMRICFMSAGGKVPVRSAALAEWRKHPCFEAYDGAIPDLLIKGLDASGRWGFREGRAFPLIADVYSKHVFAEALNEMVADDLSVDETMKRIVRKMAPFLEEPAAR